jgi:hypothetical protein
LRPRRRPIQRAPSGCPGGSGPAAPPAAAGDHALGLPLQALQHAERGGGPRPDRHPAAPRRQGRGVCVCVGGGVKERAQQLGVWGGGGVPHGAPGPAAEAPWL